MIFKEWLLDKGFGSNTAIDYSSFIEKKFKLYLHELSLSIENIEHETIMQYIRHRKSKNIRAKTINLELKKISHYMDYKELTNIAEHIRVKGVNSQPSIKNTVKSR